MGLAVGAACIALAVFLPGIGTVAAGALLGAGMGAISASVAGAVSDYSSGNVQKSWRSHKEYGNFNDYRSDYRSNRRSISVNEVVWRRVNRCRKRHLLTGECALRIQICLRRKVSVCV